MARHGASPEAEKRARQKFEKTRLKQIKFVLNDNTDADVIELLDGIDNKRGYLLDLIRSDMARRKAGE